MSINYKKRILFIADHASNYIPDSLNNLGLPKNLIDSHISFDLGIRDLCMSLSKSCNAKYIAGDHSRLIIDINRGEKRKLLSIEIEVNNSIESLKFSVSSSTW